MKKREQIDPAELAWLNRVLELADAHPITPEERDAAIAKAERERPSITLSEAASIARTNRAAGTSPELDEAVRLLSMFVERIRDGQRRPAPRLGPGGVQI